jgi:outer membrane protein assembly factor BamB
MAAGLLVVLAAPAATARPAAGTPTSKRPVAGQVRAPWPERVVMTENDYLARAAQVLDPAHGLLYALVPRKLPSVSGPWMLRAVRLSSKTSRSGGTYPVSGIALAGGFLWAYGASPAGQALISEIDPRTLRTVRSEKIASGYLGVGGVAAGSAGSVWTGSGRKLLRLSARTGAVLAQATLPAGLVLDQIAVSPGGTVLYASTVRVNAGGCVMFEYSAVTGRLLARAAGPPLAYAVAGAVLTAVPGGVWASFRTGMMGQSVLLSQRGLATIAKASASPQLGPYEWPMSSSAVYGGGTLWVATGSGLVACLNPATGAIRAEQTVTSQTAQLWDLLAVDHAQRLVYGLTPGSQALVALTPPPRCWH